MKKRLYLVHAQGRYGENCYVPFSVGCLWAYARSFPEIDDAYELVDFLYLKEPIETAVARLEAPHLIGIAHYIWNAEWNKRFARAVKETWPECRIIVGGVQVPDESSRILQEHPEFDFAIYGEGEGAFADFLRTYKELELEPGCAGYGTVGSLVWRGHGQSHDRILVNTRRPFTDLAELRSPYLDGIFDSLWPREKRWQVLQETARGCPYACTFCAWGQAALSELRLFPEERVRAELEWFGQRKVDYIDNADANYGIVKRDVELTRALVEVKRRYGYPKTFRTSFAKNSNDVIWEIANILHDSGTLKSVTLAMQSMNDEVLVNIKRKNIKYSKFGDLIQRYSAVGIPTYTEIILGLAGESLASFLEGIDRNLEAGQHSGLFAYLNIMLENTEQKNPTYIRAHGLETLNLQAMLTHGTPDDTVPRERQEIVVATTAMPHEDWKRGYLHMKTVEIFHAQGLLQDCAIAARARGVRYRDFYAQLLDWCLAKGDSTVAGREVTAVSRLLATALSGGSWDCVDSRLGNISWPPEEFAFARICLELERFYDEVEDFLTATGCSSEEAAAQRSKLGLPWKDTVAWAREAVWYGRKGRHAELKRKAS